MFLFESGWVESGNQQLAFLSEMVLDVDGLTHGLGCDFVCGFICVGGGLHVPIMLPGIVQSYHRDIHTRAVL